MSNDEIMAKLPEQCFSLSEYSGEIILLKKGETGYYPTSYSASDPVNNHEFIAELNVQLGVSKAQEQAMKIGSLFGWDVPGIDPDLYVVEEPDHSHDVEQSTLSNLEERISDAQKRSKDLQQNAPDQGKEERKA